MNGEMGTMSQAWLIGLPQRLSNGMMLRDLLLNIRVEFQHMLIARCHRMVQFEHEIATLKANVRKSMGVYKAPCEMVKSHELESQEER